MKNENMVAKILKGYAIVNAIGSILPALILAAAYDDEFTVILFFVAALVVSGLIYAFGEVISLLQAIKDNMGVASVPNRTETAGLSDKFMQIAELNEKLSQGTITQEQYDEEKQKIMNSEQQ